MGGQTTSLPPPPSSRQRVVFPARLPPASFARAVSAALRLPDAVAAGPAATNWPAQAAAAWHASVRDAFGDARVRTLLGAARAQGASMGAVLRWLEVRGGAVQSPAPTLPSHRTRRLLPSLYPTPHPCAAGGGVLAARGPASGCAPSRALC